MAAELFVQQLCMQKHPFFTLRVTGGLTLLSFAAAMASKFSSAMRRPINRPI
jgi:hypothetical protein